MTGTQSRSGQAQEKFGVTNFGAVAWALFAQGGRGNIFDEALRQKGIPYDRKTVDTMVAIYRAHQPAISLLPDAVGCLRALRGRARLAVISDGPLESQRNKVNALGLLEFVDKVVLTATWGTKFVKPHIRAFEEIQQYFGCEGRQCFYVGDNPIKDFLAPRRLRWRTVRIRRKEGLHASVYAPEHISAEIEVTDLSNLAKIVGVRS